MGKALVVYYSFEGNTKFIAESIAMTINADIVEIKPVNEIKTKGFMKYVWGGSQIMMKKKPDIEHVDIEIDKYDVIFVGTPVWAWTYAPPVNTFISEHNIKNKKVALFTCHGGQNAKTFEKLKDALPGNSFVGEKDFFEPLLKDKNFNANRAMEWAKAIMQ